MTIRRLAHARGHAQLFDFDLPGLQDPLRHLRADDPPRCHTQLLDFGPPDVQGLLRHLRGDDPPPRHAQLFDFGLPDVQGLLRHLRADDAPQTRYLRCTLGAGMENYAPQVLRHYSLRSKGTVMSTTPVS